MAQLNLAALRERMNSLKGKGNPGVWRPKPGQYTIRIVPYKYDQSNPFREVYFHYDLNKKNLVSPKTIGNPDPIEELSIELQRQAGGDKDAWKQAKKMEPTLRIYVPVLVRGEEQDGVRFWGIGKKTYEELAGVCLDPDYGDITDIKSGRDIAVEIIDGSKQVPKKTYNSVTIRVKPNVSVAFDLTNAKLVELIKNMKDINEVFPAESYETLAEEMNKFLNAEPADASTDDVAPETPSQSSTKQVTQERVTTAPITEQKATPTQTTTPPANQAAASFEDLFNS